MGINVGMDWGCRHSTGTLRSGQGNLKVKSLANLHNFLHFVLFIAFY